MGQMFKTEYWMVPAQAIWQWLLSKVFVDETLLELAIVILCIFLAWTLAKPLRPRLSAWIEQRRFKKPAVVQFLDTFQQLLKHILALVLLWLASAAFEQSGTRTHILNLFGSLLTAWVVIRLLSSIVHEKNWSRFIAVTAWTLAALHILSLLHPAIALLDKLAVNLGGVRLSFLLLIKAVIVTAILLKLALSTSGLLEKRILTLEGLTPSVQVLLSKALKVTLLILAVVIALGSLGINISTFAFLGGAIGVGIGFGLQKVVSNLVSGLILLLDKSIKPGDVIEIGQTYGRIQSLGARYVSVATRDGTEYLIPNEDLITQQVINWSFTDRLVRLKLTVGVSYDSDIHKVIQLMVEAAMGIPRVLGDPKPVCQLKNFGDSSIDMELRMWISDPENGVSNVSSDARIAIWDSFKRHHIEIPYPQRDLHIKSRTGSAE